MAGKSYQHGFLQIYIMAILVNGVISGGCGGCGYCTHTHPCAHGSCHTPDGGEHYTCSCYAGWYGTNCNYVDCSNPANHCSNGGQCHPSVTGTSFTCTCNEGWMGNTCALVDCSSSIYCLNGGTCIPTSDGYSKTCICAYGWTGSNCEKIDVCTPYENADIVFAIDVSASLHVETEFGARIEFVKNFVSQFPIGPLDYRFQFSVLTYSGDVKVHFYLNEYINMTELLDAIDSISVENGDISLTGNMLKTVREEVFQPQNGGRSPVQKYLIVLTDGLSSNPEDTKLQADILRNFGAKTFVIGTGHNVWHEELIDVATYYGHVFTMATNESLQLLLQNSMFGCDDCSNKITDVALLMDVSKETSVKQLHTLTNGATRIVKKSTVGSSAVQFSYTLFSNHYNTIYHLNTHIDSTYHISDINGNTFHDEQPKSNMSNTLQYLASGLYSTANGGRANARKVAIVFSSGNVTDDFNDIQAKSQQLKDSGIIVVAVGISQYTNMTVLKTLASDPSLLFVLGDDMYTDVPVLDTVNSLLEYSECSHFT